MRSAPAEQPCSPASSPGPRRPCRAANTHASTAPRGSVPSFPLHRPPA
jgi:hypothetical protein